MGNKNSGNRSGKPRAPGGGRKPSAFTLLKRRIEAEKIDDAEYAFALYAQTMRDETKPLGLRLECASWVANRVLGTPKAHNETDHAGELVIRVIRDARSRDYPADAASRAGKD